MNLLNELREKLEQVDPVVFYGMVDNRIKETIWDYTVFNRTRLKSAANKTGFTDYIDIHIVRENYIPEGLDTEMITKVLEIDGMRLANEDGIYTYVEKNNTNTVVEMLTLSFMRARK